MNCKVKIVSLVPSITELLFDFGLSETDVIGRTKFCIHPENLVKKVEIIGGTKNLNLEKIKSLKPDLIIANKEENEKGQVEELGKEFKILLTNVATIEDNYYFLKNLGRLLGKMELAQNYNLKIYEILEKVKLRNPLKVAYLIWKNPYMTIGGDTFIHNVLQEIGFENIFAEKKRYPIISIDDLQQADLIFLSTEPYPFNKNHLVEMREKFPKKKIILVDGEAFSWFGTHLAKCENYFTSLLAEF